MKLESLLSLSAFVFLTSLTTLHAQNVLFDANFNSTLQSAEGESPTTASGISFVEGIQQDGILVEDEGVLQYVSTNNVSAGQGSITLWVKPNWVPGGSLRRILVIESSPVFELHVDGGSSLVLAMFSDQIETRVVSADVSGWSSGDWHFISINWNQERVEIYVDGAKVGEGDVGFQIPTFEAGIMHLGSLRGLDAFDGILDELKIYDAPLNSDQIMQEFEMGIDDKFAEALTISDVFGRDVTQGGMTLVDWEGPVRNPAMKFFIQATDSLTFPMSVSLSTEVENTSFNLPSSISSTGPAKTIILESKDSLEFFLFSYYMDEDYKNDSFDLVLGYKMEGIPVRQIIPVTVLDQDWDRAPSYPVIVDFSEAVHPLMVDPATQSVIVQAANDWLYYIDGTSIDEIPAGGSSMTIGGQDHFFEEKTVSNPVPYTGYYLYAFGNSNPGPCVCSTGAPNRELLQTSNGEVVPIFRIGALHLNIFGQAFETEPTGWEILSPYENWTMEGNVGTDIYSLAKHEIGHAMVFENSPLFLLAQGRDPNNPFPDESIMNPPNGFTSPALSDYYPDEVVPLFLNSLSHVVGVLDPASKTPPYGGGVDDEVMPNGREMLTKLDILIMESVGYPLRENEVTKPLSLTSEDALIGTLGMNFSANLLAEGGIPVYDFSLSSGSLPQGISLDRKTGKLNGIPEEAGEFPVTFMVKDYDERSLGSTFTETIIISRPLSNSAELLSFAFDSTLTIIETTIDSVAQSILFRVEQGSDISNLTPLIEISDGATISPSADLSQDFTAPVVYTITSEDGSKSVTWTIIIDMVVSNNNYTKPAISIYPNPANHKLTAEILGIATNQSELLLFNVQGQMIRKSNPFWNVGEIALEDVSNGLYLLKIVNKNFGASTHKIAVTHK